MDVTYNFTAGTRAVAGQVNQNFADVKSAVDPLETDVADIKTQLTSGIILPDGSVDFTRLQSYKTYVVSNATNATPIVITAVAHGFLTGDKVYISGVGGNTAANGTFTITKISSDTFSLDSSVGNGAFSSNGTAIIVPVGAGNLINKAYLDANAGALKTEALGIITSGTTLKDGYVSTAHVSDTFAINLPTTLSSGIENVSIFDFTTTSTSQPTITSSRNLTGTCAVTNGDTTVTGTSTLFLTELEVGSKITIATVDYQVLSIASNTSLELTANYAGTTASGLTVGHKFIKWSSLNGGKAPTAYSIISGVRNVLVFKTHDNGLTWEAEYSSYGGVETAFTRPNLSANGTLGGTSFAVSADSQLDTNHQPFYAVDNNNGTLWENNVNNTGYFIFYNPQALKVSILSVKNYTSSANLSITAGSVYASNNGTNWTYLNAFTNSNTGAGVTWQIIVNSTDFYKYYKIAVTATSSAQVGITELGIAATYIAT